MPHVVGPKGQVVISKDLRDRLGVEPGWTTLQRLNGDHIEVYFIPPPHRKSLKGQLAGFIKTRISSGTAWENARKKAWKIAAKEQNGEAKKTHA